MNRDAHRTGSVDSVPDPQECEHDQSTYTPEGKGWFYCKECKASFYLGDDEPARPLE